MQMAMHEAHLRAQGEDGGGDRPGAQAGAVHGQAEHSGDENERENQLQPWAASKLVPGPRLSPTETP